MYEGYREENALKHSQVTLIQSKAYHFHQTETIWHLGPRIYMWTLISGELIKTFTGHTDIVSSVAFSPNGEYLASGSFDYTILVWKVSRAERILTLRSHSDSVRSVVFSPNGEYLASGSLNMTISVWSVSSGENIRTLIGHSDPI